MYSYMKNIQINSLRNTDFNSEITKCFDGPNIEDSGSQFLIKGVFQFVDVREKRQCKGRLTTPNDI